MDDQLAALRDDLRAALLLMARESVCSRGSPDYPREDERAVAYATITAALQAGTLPRGDAFNSLRRAAILHLNPCHCPSCDRQGCIHRGAYRRMPRAFGGLDLCPNL